MLDTASSMATIIFGLIVVAILLRVLVLVHQQTKKMEQLKRELHMKEQAREEKEKQ
jgi:flagellar biosynthesis/type III secretory pathway M-ring protein FliF/YscJ